MVVTESEDVGDMRTAEHHKNLLQEQLGRLENLGLEMLTLVPHEDSAKVANDDKESFECSKEKLTFSRLRYKVGKSWHSLPGLRMLL